MNIPAAHHTRLSPNTTGLYEARIPERLRGYSGRISTNPSGEDISPSEITTHARNVSRDLGGSIVLGVAPNREVYYGVVWSSTTDITEMYALSSKIGDRRYFDVKPHGAYRQVEIIEDDSIRTNPNFPSHSVSSFISKCLGFASHNSTVKCVISDNTEEGRFIGLVGNEKEISKIREINLELD